MSYGVFLGLFLGVPLLVLASLAHRHLSRGLLITLLLVSAVAVLYTGPWDNLIVADGVWSYSRGQILGLVVGRVPLEEYAFYVLQVFLTGLVTTVLLWRLPPKPAC